MKFDYMLRLNSNYPECTISYIMKQDTCSVTGSMSLGAAVRIINQGKARISDEYPDYPLTADGVYYFPAMYRIFDDDDKEVKSNDELHFEAR